MSSAPDRSQSSVSQCEGGSPNSDLLVPHWLVRRVFPNPTGREGETVAPVSSSAPSVASQTSARPAGRSTVPEGQRRDSEGGDDGNDFKDGSGSFRSAPGPPSRAYRRSFFGNFAAPAGIATPTPRRRFKELGWEWARSIELVKAVIFLYLTPLFDLCFTRYAGRKTNDDTAEVRDRMALE